MYRRTSIFEALDFSRVAKFHEFNLTKKLYHEWRGNLVKNYLIFFDDNTVFCCSFCRRRGEAIATEQKFGAAQNKHTATTLNTTKLDRETEELKHDRVPLEIGKLIQKGRNDKVQFCNSHSIFLNS